jgi:uncharacterized protein YjbJ (UPF0337 family)
MNKDQFKGSWQQFKGELKKKWGQLTDDDLLEAEGNYDKFLGVLQKDMAIRREEVSKWADEWYSKREQEDRCPKATESRKPSVTKITRIGLASAENLG